MKNRIDRKFYLPIWLALGFASLVQSVYPIYVTFVQLEENTFSGVLIEVFRTILSYGVFPTAICFLLAFMAYMIGARRYLVAVPRNDFFYTVMIFTAAARLIGGIIESACILVPKMYVFTSAILNPLLQTVAYTIMFFVVFARVYKLNPVEKYASFRVGGMVYLILLGISMVVENSVYLLAVLDPNAFANFNDILEELYGIVLVRDNLQVAASATALSLYAVFVIAAAVVGEIMRSQAKGYQSPETRGEYFDSHPNNPYEMREDVGQTYSDFDEKNDDDKNNDNNSGSGNVFDEFDI
ncbi:MAG: hypothetical protein J5713_02440 [Clostridia bacterium]|nr:hypothetical protein [Clostridia bacterium]